MSASRPIRPSPVAIDFDAGSVGEAAFSRQALLDAEGSVLGWKVGLFSGDRSALAAAARAVQGTSAAGVLVWWQASLDTLLDPQLEQFDARRTVLQFEPPARNDADVVAQCVSSLAACRRLGFRVAGSSDLPASGHPLSKQLDILVVDVSAADSPAAIQKAREPGLPLLVQQVHTEEQRRQAQALGARWFAGDWFMAAPVAQRTTIRPSHALLLELISMVKREAELAEIETVLRRDPLLALRLLRLINHCGYGLPVKITSFAHAVMLLGLRKLLRWCCMLMATDKGDVPPATGYTAVVRGRFMEVLAQHLLGEAEGDSACIAGMFSLLDAMTGLPFDRLLNNLALPQDVVAALCEQRGPLYPLLQLAVAIERDDRAGFTRARSELGLSDAQVARAHLEALAWTADVLARQQ
ncbi:HDOD domain-containing protein [Ramlibacter sp. AW1]|uniref:HDOD domain-containing protein n=1 Tax=Ramlibacter aurantiacus TaxID=2801330 RepID=A0A937D9M3_9BURK|nr:HDOD domain-containing protein [Ramlibacter aurantiacus]MBL0423336.1 HDOD domain-containing protein [Ramlibacter aurantiacus]